MGIFSGPPPPPKGTHGHSQGNTTSTVQAKIFTFDQLHYGDGQQDNGKLGIQSDGLGLFECNVLTYHTSNVDIWHSNFQLMDATGKQLFGTEWLDGPKMKNNNPPNHYIWTVRFLFPPEIFNAIASVVQNYKC